MTFWAKNRSARILGKAIGFREMDKKALISSGRLQFP